MHMNKHFNHKKLWFLFRNHLLELGICQKWQKFRIPTSGHFRFCSRKWNIDSGNRKCGATSCVTSGATGSSADLYPRPRLPGQHLEGRAPERRMDGRTKYPLYSTGHCPSGAAALLTIGKSEEKKKSRARVLLTIYWPWSTISCIPPKVTSMQNFIDIG